MKGSASLRHFEQPASDPGRAALALWHGLRRPSVFDSVLGGPLAAVQSMFGKDQRLRLEIARSRLSGGSPSSRCLREALWRRHQVLLGAWSFCDGRTLRELPPHVVIGRYCSIAARVLVANENHPLGEISSHAALYDPSLGFVRERTLPLRPWTIIGHDVWIGGNACILPGCRVVGHGAVIGAGAVVTNDVPPLAVVGGNPARVLRMRFEQGLCERWLHSAWWRLSPSELTHRIEPGLGCARQLEGIGVCDWTGPDTEALRRSEAEFERILGARIDA